MFFDENGISSPSLQKRVVCRPKRYVSEEEEPVKKRSKNASEINKSTTQKKMSLDYLMSSDMTKEKMTMNFLLGMEDESKFTFASKFVSERPQPKLEVDIPVEETKDEVKKRGQIERDHVLQHSHNRKRQR